MKLVMTLLVRDEADIIESNIEYHIRVGVDYFIAMDNLSCDGTGEILRKYESIGLLRYLYQPDDTYSQYKWVTEMARLAAREHGADWVINNDADEFWVAESGSLKSTLEAVPARTLALKAERLNFLPSQEDIRGEFFEKMIVREEKSLNHLGRPLPGKVCHRALPDIITEQGNHNVRRERGELVAAPMRATVLHFQMRSYAEFENKIAKAGAAYERNNDLDSGVGSVRRHLYKIFCEGKLKEYYDEMRPSMSRIDSGLADGSLIVDTRVRDAISEIPERRF